MFCPGEDEVPYTLNTIRGAKPKLNLIGVAAKLGLSLGFQPGGNVFYSEPLDKETIAAFRNFGYEIQEKESD